MAAAQTSSVTSSSSAVAVSNLPESLLSLAQSLISTYYPSTTITDPASLTFPATVVIDGSTIAVHPSPATLSTISRSSNSITTSSAPASTSSGDGSAAATTQHHHSDPFGDRKLAILLGTILGFLALALLVVCLACVYRKRRKDNAAARFQALSAETEALRPKQPDMSEGGPYPRPPNAWLGPQTRNDDQMSSSLLADRAFAGKRLVRSEAEQNPFIAPYERVDAHPTHHGIAMATTLPTALATARHDVKTAPEPMFADERANRSSESLPFFTPHQSAEHSRGEMPLLAEPTESTSTNTPAYAVPLVHRHHAEDSHDTGIADHGNQCAWADDGFNDQPISRSPTLPRKSSRRESLRMITYPSWQEVAAFDFGDHGWRVTRDTSRSRRESMADVQMYEGT